MSHNSDVYYYSIDSYFEVAFIFVFSVVILVYVLVILLCLSFLLIFQF